MENAVIAALAAGLKTTATRTREGLAAGTYEIDEVVEIRVRGTLTVGDDHEARNMGKVPMYETLALALHHAGVTGDAALAAIERAMREALTNDEAVKGLVDKKAVQAVEERVRRKFATLPATTRKGAVKFKGETGEVITPIAAE